MSPSYYLLSNFYLNKHFFAVSSDAEIFNISPILAGVSQGAVLSPTLYNIYTADQSIHPDTSVAEYVDDKVIYSTHTNSLTVSTSLQNHLDLLFSSYIQWRVKVNELKSINTTFTLKLQQPPPFLLNNELIHYSNTLKYVGLYFDTKTQLDQTHTYNLTISKSKTFYSP